MYESAYSRVIKLLPRFNHSFFCALIGLTTFQEIRLYCRDSGAIAATPAMPLSVYTHQPGQQQLHKGFFLLLPTIQLLLMKGDKVIERLESGHNFALFVF